jgi:hypothetical protein
VTELKQYANAGNLAMSDIMVLVTSLKPFMVAAAPPPSPSTAAAGEAGSGSWMSESGDGGRFGGSVHSTVVLGALNYLTESMDELREVPKEKRRMSSALSKSAAAAAAAVAAEEGGSPSPPAHRPSIVRPTAPRPIVRSSSISRPVSGSMDDGTEL